MYSFSNETSLRSRGAWLSFGGSSLNSSALSLLATSQPLNSSPDALESGPQSPGDALSVRPLVLLLLLVLAAGVASNLLLVLAIRRERRLQTSINLLLSSLAGADLLVCLLVMPLALAAELRGERRCCCCRYRAVSTRMREVSELLCDQVVPFSSFVKGWVFGRGRQGL